MFGNGIADRGSDGIDICQDVIIPEAKNAVAARFKITRSARIRCAVSMLPAVDFDDNAEPVAGEIGKVWADRSLPSEMRRTRRHLAKPLPQLSLGIR